MLCEILLAIFGTIGLAACLRYVLSRLLFPVRGVMILIPGQGDGAALEHTVKGVRALSATGKLEHESIYIADCGLSREGLATAQRLCRRYPDVEFCVLDGIDTV